MRYALLGDITQCIVVI